MVDLCSVSQEMSVKSIQLSLALLLVISGVCFILPCHADEGSGDCDEDGLLMPCDPLSETQTRSYSLIGAGVIIILLLTLILVLLCGCLCYHRRQKKGVPYIQYSITNCVPHREMEWSTTCVIISCAIDPSVAIVIIICMCV